VFWGYGSDSKRMNASIEWMDISSYESVESEYSNWKWTMIKLDSKLTTQGWWTAAQLDKTGIIVFGAQQTSTAASPSFYFKVPQHQCNQLNIKGYPNEFYPS